jgi:polyhydroxybutyrate depolymerase
MVRRAECQNADASTCEKDEMTAITVALAVLCADPLSAGDYTRTVVVDGRTRSYHVHIPQNYDSDKPTPVVLAYHGAMTNGLVMAGFSGLSKKADEAGFIVVYPNGNGRGDLALVWNSGGVRDKAVDEKLDDVGFTSKLLDDLETVARVDPQRIYATGLSNGGMMCYRLAAELSDRIAAVAPVAGTMAIEKNPKRPVPIIHFHGTRDKLVPYGGPEGPSRNFLPFKSVDETMRIWCRLDGCPAMPVTADLPDLADDGTTVTRKSWGPGKDGAEVILYTIEGGGHTWPGRPRFVEFLGKSTRDISANDLIWEFFQKHPME